MKTAAAATPSYHSAWNLAHGRMAKADAERNEYLRQKLEQERARGPIGHNESSRRWMAKWRARQQVKCECGSWKDKESVRCKRCARRDRP